MSPVRVTVRPDPTDPLRFYFDFDPVAPGGRGGASIRLDPDIGLVSIDGVHKNSLLPPRSTGGVVADGLLQTFLPRPTILEAYNVERTTAATLTAGGTGLAGGWGKCWKTRRRCWAGSSCSGHRFPTATPGTFAFTSLTLE